jgi:hypothetical protein
MSEGLLKAARLNIPYFQSPIDDLWSFYYVAQWADVFNNANLSDNNCIPTLLMNLRELIAGSHGDRVVRTGEVTDPGLDRTEYGSFLADCCSILHDWEWKLRSLPQTGRRPKLMV